METAEMKATHNIYSQMSTIKPTVQYSKIMSIGRARLRGKPFNSENLSLPLPVSPCRYFHFRYLLLCYPDIVRGGR